MRSQLELTTAGEPDVDASIAVPFGAFAFPQPAGLIVLGFMRVRNQASPQVGVSVGTAVVNSSPCSGQNVLLFTLFALLGIT